MGCFQTNNKLENTTTLPTATTLDSTPGQDRKKTSRKIEPLMLNEQSVSMTINTIWKKVTLSNDAGLQFQDFKRFSQNYTLSAQEIGKGHYGKVYAAHLRGYPEFQVAVKIFQKADLSQTVINFIKDEVLAMSKLDHPNIVKLIDVYESNTTIYLVIEYCEGGDLYDKLTNDFNQISEEKARKIMKKILFAINHCHANGIVHRDLKPENIMLKVQYRDFNAADIKIIDFGLCKVLSYNQKQQKYIDGHMTGVVGTTYYSAPEVLQEQGHYGMACDYWSLGVILYVLLSGHLPFPGRTHEEIEQKIFRGQIDFTHIEFKTVSDQGKELIMRFLDPDTKTRINCAQALKHPWFNRQVPRRQSNQNLSQFQFKSQQISPKTISNNNNEKNSRNSFAKFDFASGSLSIKTKQQQQLTSYNYQQYSPFLMMSSLAQTTQAPPYIASSKFHSKDLQLSYTVNRLRKFSPPSPLHMEAMRILVKFITSFLSLKKSVQQSNLSPKQQTLWYQSAQSPNQSVSSNQGYQSYKTLYNTIKKQPTRAKNSQQNLNAVSGSSNNLKFSQAGSPHQNSINEIHKDQLNRIETSIIAQIESLEQIFIDTFDSKNGFLTKTELKTGFNKSNIDDLEEVKDSEITEIIQKIDFQSGERITFLDFLALTLDMSELIKTREDFVSAVFRYFDVDQNGLITNTDIIAAFNKTGKQIDPQDAKIIIKCFTPQQILAGINYPRFHQLLLSTQHAKIEDCQEKNDDLQSNILIQNDDDALEPVPEPQFSVESLEEYTLGHNNSSSWTKHLKKSLFNNRDPMELQSQTPLAALTNKISVSINDQQIHQSSTTNTKYKKNSQQKFTFSIEDQQASEMLQIQKQQILLQLSVESLDSQDLVYSSEIQNKRKKIQDQSRDEIFVDYKDNEW